MRSKRVKVSLPWYVWEDSSKECLIERLHDRLQVYLNHEDTDFPFEYLEEENFVIDKDSDISINVLDLYQNRSKLSLTVELSYTLKRLKKMEHGESLRSAWKTVRFEIDPDEGRVDVYV